jgi:hypothetical protein
MQWTTFHEVSSENENKNMCIGTQDNYRSSALSQRWEADSRKACVQSPVCAS